jgi:hypothetical protein
LVEIQINPAPKFYLMQTNFSHQKDASRNGINFLENKLKQTNSEQRKLIKKVQK